jgi:CRISPR/Cas system-associated protein Cas10 (large subunit of type III CRISPR-Cas system)
LLKVINELEAAYRDKINATLNGKPASISVGAVICPHKHPLSLAVDTADYMLNEVAKKEPGKASVAISLVKGHSETSQLICKIQDGTLFSIHDLEALFSAKLPRGFVYKLSEEEMVLAKTLLTKDDVLKYVGSVYERSHDRQATLPEALERAINKMEWPAEVPKTLNRLLEHLYFVRFLEGEAS